MGNAPFDRLPQELADSQREYFERLVRVLPQIPSALLLIRTRRSLLFCQHTCADRQRSRLNGSPVASYALHVSMLLDELLALLEGAPSEETLAALAAAPGLTSAGSSSGQGARGEI
jgi:hypothetical protein